MAAIHQLATRYGVRIIEDASHAIGGSYQGQKIGGCQYSDITIFSFHPVKIITTGEGGVAVTNDGELVKRMARLRSHGITRYPSEMIGTPDGAWSYQQIDLGFNYRMTEMQAALGLSQLNQIDAFVKERCKLVSQYDELLKLAPVDLPKQSPDTQSSHHLYIVRVRLGSALGGRKEVFDKMRADGIGVNVHYIPVYRQPYYSQMGFLPEQFPSAEDYYARAITLPLFPGLTGEEQIHIVNSLTKPSGYQTIF